MTKKQQPKRKTDEAESESTQETSQKASKKQKTVVVEPRRSERIFRLDSDLSRAAKSLRISSGSDSSSRSSYELKDLPSDASSFTEDDVAALNAVFIPADAEENVIPDVEATNLPNQYLLPEIARDVFLRKNFNVRQLNTTDIYVKQFFWSLYRVVVNLGVDIGTSESKTDSLVNILLTRALGFDGWPFGVRLKEKYKLAINGKNVSATPDFVVDMDEINILVAEDKHLKNVAIPDFGESQILAEILACGWENLDRYGRYTDQTIYAIRVISTYVTFYKAEIPKAYWKELKKGLPQKQSIEILRWPGENAKDSGLDLSVVEDRDAIFEAITKLREHLLLSDSSTATFTTVPTTTSTTASSSTTNVTALAEQSSKSEGKKPLK